MPKCQVCNEIARKAELMVCEAKELKDKNKDGTPKMQRKYVHPNCYPLYLKRKEFLASETKKLDELYAYVTALHGWVKLTGPMVAKIQDLRNGTIKVKDHYTKKYKDGVTFELMLQTYKYVSSTTDHVLRTMTFKDEWNEFSYVFSIMERHINEVNQMNKRQQKNEENLNAPINSEIAEAIDIDVSVKKKKGNDDLDITSFL